MVLRSILVMVLVINSLLPANANIIADLHCADVTPNGDVTLTWSVTPGTTCNFDSLEIYSLQDGYLNTLNNVSTVTYTHVGANADISAKHYFVKVFSDCSGVPIVTFSDTLSTIHLEMNDLGDGRVLLEWNPNHIPQNNGDQFMQNIMREHPVGVWTLRKQIPFGTYSYRDTIDICEDSLNYRIEIPNSQGCISGSNIKGDSLKDILNPYAPEIALVSVDTVNDRIEINWDVNPAKDTYGYIILKLVDGIPVDYWDIIDTVYGRTNTTYYDLNSQHNSGSETYSIAAFDSCLVPNTPPNYQTSFGSDAHTSVYLTNEVDLCDLNMRLYWTSYTGWDGDVTLDHYEVILQRNNTLPVVIATVPSNKTSYFYPNLVRNDRYCFYVRAVSSNGLHSYSNEDCEVIVPASNPKYHYLSMASHLLSNEIEIEYYTDSTATVEYFELEKKGPGDIDFSIIQTFNPTGNSFYNYVDSDVQPGIGAYQYKVNIIDTCGAVSLTSNLGKTIFLSVKTDQSTMVNTLSWTGYEEFDGGIQSYRVYRGYDGVYGAPIATISSNIRSFVDDLSGEFDSEGRFCYRIEAVEPVNSHGFSRTAFSNEVCVVFEPVVHIPNAIIVNGVNTEFLPVIRLYDYDSYRLQIFDRWGSVMFNSTSKNTGWKGTRINGTYVPEGVYVYLLTFSDAEGKNYEFAGSVTVLFRD